MRCTWGLGELNCSGTCILLVIVENEQSVKLPAISFVAAPAPYSIFQSDQAWVSKTEASQAFSQIPKPPS